MEEAIERMTQRGVWLSPQVKAFAIRNAKAFQS
jgi:hypothetical protein